LLLAVTPVLRRLVPRLAVAPGEAPRTSCAGCGAALRPDGRGWLARTPLGRCGRCHTAVGAAAWSLKAVCGAAIAVVMVVAAPAPVRLATLWWPQR
jgi:hypothetical protein